MDVTAANVNDTTPAIDLLDAIPGIRGRRGRRRKRPDCFQGDRAYGSASNRRACWVRGIRPLLASPGMPHGSGLGKTRWVIERTQAWFTQFRRLRVCYERTYESTIAFHLVASVMIIWNVIASGL